MTGKRIMVVGLGHLGSQVLDMMLRIPGDHTYLVAGRNREYLHQRTNLSSLVALQLGYVSHVSCVELDLFNVDQTAHTIAKFKPDIIFSAVSLQSWWVITTLPHEAFAAIDKAQVGPWLPMHLTLAYKLMSAVKETGLNVCVVSSSFPDVVHPVLSKAGLAPMTGIGNVSNAVPALRRSIGVKLGRAVDQVEVRFVAHHYVSHRVSRHGNSGGAPFHLTALVDGEDVTHQLDMETIFDLMPTHFKRPGGLPGQMMTAASATTVLDALANDRRKVLHAPGPNGLPGGYPIETSNGFVRTALPPVLSEAEAIRINEESHRFEGIERIDEHGTVHFTDREMGVLSEMLGYSCKQMALWETEDRARELRAKYLEFASKFH